MKTKPGLQLLFVYYDEIAFFKEVIGSKVAMAFDQFKGVDSQIVLLTYGLEIGFSQDGRQLIDRQVFPYRRGFSFRFGSRTSNRNDGRPDLITPPSSEVHEIWTEGGLAAL